MNVWQWAMAATGAYAGAIVGACLWLKWRDRKKLPMPPLQRRIPGLPVDNPDTPLTPHERVRFQLLAMSCKDPDIVAADPTDQA